MFERYLSKLKRWTFYFFIPQHALTIELRDVFGSTHDTKYKLPADAFAINRYGKMLAGEVSLLISSLDGHNCKFGSITVLPFIAEGAKKRR